MYPKGRAWIEIKEESLKANAEAFRSILPEGCKIMAAVKANAYGHGAAQVAGILQQQGVEDFCVAALAEGIELRKAGIRGQILILGYTHPDQLMELTAYDLTQAVVDKSYAESLKAFARHIKVHICIDTGMHRLGERFEKMEDILSMWEIPNLEITGIFSHLCVADSTQEGFEDYTRYQISNFRGVLRGLEEKGITGLKAHLMSSYGILNYPEEKFDYVRLGIALYGILSCKEDRTKLQLKLQPVLTLKARVQSVRVLKEGESAGYGLTYTADKSRRIAALSIGYADGIPRCLSNRGYVLIAGKRAPIAGRICMDQLLADVTDIPQAEPGTEAVLIGRSMEEEIRAEEFASWADTITNEVLSRLGSRLERIVE